MEDLSDFNNVNPDTIYDFAPDGSMTFFYIPQSKNLHIQPYPTSHRDMMEDDDIADDVYPNQRISQQDKSRGRILQKTNVLLGRIGAYGGQFCITLWSHPTNEILGNFLAKLYKLYPAFQKIQDKTVVVFPGEAHYLTSLLGGNKPNPQRAVKLKKTQDTPKQIDTKKYEIDHGLYSLSDLQALRSAIHTKANTGFGDPMQILCHPDMDKYPELAGYRPATCGKGSANLRATHPENWRRKARELGFPYVYSYGENKINFTDWIVYQEIRETL